MGHSLGGEVREVDDPVFAAFALTNHEAAARQIEIADLEVDTLTGAETRMSQDQETSIFQTNEGVGAIQAGQDEGFEAAAIAVGQKARQPLRFRQRAEAKHRWIDRHAGVGLLPQGGQDIVQNPVDGGGGDALVGHPLALVSLQVGQVQVGRVGHALQRTRRGGGRRANCQSQKRWKSPRYLRAWMRWRRGDPLGRQRWT
jgi:hypothetical protein